MEAYRSQEDVSGTSGSLVYSLCFLSLKLGIIYVNNWRMLLRKPTNGKKAKRALGKLQKA